MKKHHFYGGLFVTPLIIKTRCSYLTNNVTNTPPLEQANHAQAELLAIQTTSDKKSSPLLRSGLLGLIRLWNSHLPDRKIIRVEEWKQST
jgi:hypothetical protein